MGGKESNKKNKEESNGVLERQVVFCWIGCASLLEDGACFYWGVDTTIRLTLSKSSMGWRRQCTYVLSHDRDENTPLRFLHFNTNYILMYISLHVSNQTDC